MPVAIVPVVLHFADGSVLDPTAELPDCAGGSSAIDRVLESPLFQDVDYGDGPRQFAEQMRRLEFWAYSGPGGLNPAYSVRLAPFVPGVMNLTLSEGFPQGTAPSPCGRIGAIEDGEAFDRFLNAHMLPAVTQLGVDGRTLIVFLLLNTPISIPGEVVLLGYHSSNREQTYGVALYNATTQAGSNPDVVVLAHELAEWQDDPFVNNATPPWGHVGQVDGCQANLEVGDPLSGSRPVEVRPWNGFRYHLPETAFFSWFYAQNPSIGYGGWYSSFGSFQAPADPCF